MARSLPATPGWLGRQTIPRNGSRPYIWHDALALAASSGHAADWRYLIGIHDFIVDDVDSHTYGVTAGMYANELTESGNHFFGSFQLSWDHDLDHLDPDRNPDWWRLHLGSDGVFRHVSRVDLGWTVDLNTRVNTVSSIEQEIQALPALIATYRGDTVQASAKRASDTSSWNWTMTLPESADMAADPAQHDACGIGCCRRSRRTRRQLATRWPRSGMVGWR